MIIIGYQGIGKSTLTKDSKYWGFIDLESSCIRINGERPDNWYEIYCNVAEELSRQGNWVFVSCHKEVRDRLKNSKEKVYLCYPSLELKQSWLERLKERYEKTGLDKDLRALENAEKSYEANIKELMTEGFKHIVIDDMSYSLEKLIIYKTELFNEIMRELFKRH